MAVNTLKDDSKRLKIDFTNANNTPNIYLELFTFPPIIPETSDITNTDPK